MTDPGAPVVTLQPGAPASGCLAAPRLLGGRILRGANIHAGRTVFSQPVEPGALAGTRVPDLGAEFATRYVERFGGLDSLGAGGRLLSSSSRAAVVNRDPGLTLVEALLEGIVAVESFVAGAMSRLDRPRFSQVVEGDGVVDLIWESHSAWVSRTAAKAAFAGLVELLPERVRGADAPAPDFLTALAALRRHARRRRWSPAIAVIAQAAKRRGLPHELLAGNYLRLGEGAMQRVISEAALELTPAAVAPAAQTAGDRGHVADEESSHRLLVVAGQLVSVVAQSPGDGVPTDVTERVHGSIRDEAVLAALRADRTVAEVVFVTEDITRSCRNGGGRVIAVLPPDLFLHALPDRPRTDAVCEAVLDLLVPAGALVTIPTALVVGERGAAVVARHLDSLMRPYRQGLGVATRHRTTIDGRPVDPTALGRRSGPERLLHDPRVTTIVTADSPHRIVARGLRLSRATVTALLDPVPGRDSGVYRAAAAVSVGATKGTVVIGAENPCAEWVLDSLPPASVFLVARRRRHPLVVRHTSAGGFVVHFGSGRASVSLRRDGERVGSIPVMSPARRRGGLGRRPDVSLFTAGMAFALDPSAWQRAGRRDTRRASRPAGSCP